MTAEHEAWGRSEGHGTVEYFHVPCFSLVTILKALGVKRVDYFSLDIEGWFFGGIFNWASVQ